jgi:hypothetical protein
MARAGRVPGIRPRDTLAENAARVIDFRLAELLSWREALADETRVTDLHNMRIAAKRLRYALEAFEPCWPAETKALLKELTDIQEDLGDIHDLDVLSDLLRSRLQSLESPLLDRATEIMAGDGTPGEKSRELRRLLGAHAREPRRVGLYGLIGDKVAERRRRYVEFRDRWAERRLDAFADRVSHLTRPEIVAVSVESATG